MLPRFILSISSHLPSSDEMEGENVVAQTPETSSLSSSVPYLPQWTLPASFASDVSFYRNSEVNVQDKSRKEVGIGLSEVDAIAAIEKDGLVSFDPSLVGYPFFPEPKRAFGTVPIFTKPLHNLDCEFNLIGRRLRLRLRENSFKKQHVAKDFPWVLCDILR